ncbi:MAG TPA: histidinol dehydrogenase [Actinobacteria bacterium]|nr:histidinol dehydrogenase [Actinomycetota bacterium]
MRIVTSADEVEVSPGPVLSPEATETVRRIINDVKERGDGALVDLTRKFDGADVSGRILMTEDEVAAAVDSVPADLKRTIDDTAHRLRNLHERQLPQAWSDRHEGVRFGEVVRPVESAGCYVPGGRAAYPSSVLMTVIPARVAGVSRVVVATPPQEDGSVSPTVLYAAEVAGADAVYRVGGAQVVAALAYGTESIEAVAMIVGPGGLWVTVAKREVAGQVGIDGLAGPSELAIVADAGASPEVLAADLIAQAEHDPQARTTFIALDSGMLDPVRVALQRALVASPRRDIVAEALEHTVGVAVPSVEEAAALVDRLAPEHLQIATVDPSAILDLVRNFGAAFLGVSTPVPFGDYGVGSNHVLPTSRTARFASGLRSAAFVRVASFVEVDETGLERFGPDVERFANAEGLAGHARSSAIRRE